MSGHRPPATGPVHVLWAERGGLWPATALPAGAEAVVIGTSAHARAAAALGARVVAVVPGPGVGPAALPGRGALLRRRVGAALDAAAGPGQPRKWAVAWSPRDLSALPGRWLDRVVLITAEPPGHCPPGHLPARVGVVGPMALEAWRGVATGLAEAVPVPVSRRCRGTRAEARTSLGIGEDEFVISLLSDPPGADDSRLFAWIVGMLHVAGLRAVGVAPVGTGAERRAARYLRLHGRHWEVIRHTGHAAAALPAADAAVFGLRHDLALRGDLEGVSPLAPAAALRTGAPGSVADARGADFGRALPLALHAMAIGVPVIAPADAGTQWLMGEGDGLAARSLAAAVTMPAFAPRLMPLVESAAALGALAAAQKRRAAELSPPGTEHAFDAALTELTDGHPVGAGR